MESPGSTRLVALDGPAGTVQVVVDEDLSVPLGTTAYAVPRPDRVLLY